MTTASFLETIAPDGAYHFRALHDTDKSRQGHNFTDPAKLATYNQAGYGVFMVVNAGGRKKADITTIRALYADFDHPNLADNIKALERVPFPPSYVVESSPGKLHAYWCIDNMPVEDYDHYHKALVTLLGADLGAIGRARVMRVPGHCHLKATPFLSRQVYQPGPRQDWDGPFGDWLRKMAPPKPTPSAPVELTPPTTESGLYAADQLAKAYQHIASAPDGERNHTLNRKAIYPLGLAKAGHIDIEHVQQKLAEAAALAGMDDGEIAHTLGSALKAAEPQGIPTPAVDPAAAFAGTAPPGGDLLDAINTHGTDPGHTANLINQIATSVAPPLHKAACAAQLGALLKDAKLLTRPLKEALDAAGAPQQSSGAYSSKQSENAELFLASAYPGGTLVRCDDNWYAYRGKSWEVIDDATMESDIAKAMLSSSPQDSTVRGTVSSIKRLAHVRRPEVDHDLVVFNNGILNTRTWTLGPHTPDVFTTLALPYDYDPDAICPHWDEFLNTNLSGDQDLIRRLQEFFGLTMTRDTQFQKALHLVGPTRSGKGVMLKINRAMIGADNFIGGDLSNLAEDTTLTAMMDKTVFAVMDAEHKIDPRIRAKVTQRIKQITSGDTITFSRKYKSNADVSLPVRIMIASNSMLDITDGSSALASRILIVPMHVSHVGHEDRTLQDRLLTELPGIAMWALRGLSRLRTQGDFTAAAAADDETAAAAQAMNPFEGFIDDVLVVTGSKTVARLGDIYAQYRLWAAANGERHVPTRNGLNKLLRDALRQYPCRFSAHWDPIQGKAIKGWSHLEVRPQAFTPELKAVP